MLGFLITALLLGVIGGSKAHCTQEGLMTGFTGPPSVEQIKPGQVRISWKDKVEYRECADDFVVKYWIKNQTTKKPGRYSGMEYAISDLVDPSSDGLDVTVEPGIKYVFQSVARKDMGFIRGTEWKYSPSVEFTTISNTGMM